MRLGPTTFGAPYLIALLAVLQLSGCGGDNVPPSILQTTPANGAIDVDPDTSELSVTFSEEMQDGNWSWVYESRESFPQMTGQPHYVDRATRNVLPVRLEPDKEYVVWINATAFSNFRDKAGNRVIPYKLTFKTRPS